MSFLLTLILGGTCSFFAVTRIVQLPISLLFLLIFIYLPYEFPILSSNDVLQDIYGVTMVLLYILIGIFRIVSISNKS